MAHAWGGRARACRAGVDEVADLSRLWRPAPGQSASAISSACTTRLRSQTRYLRTWPGRCCSHCRPGPLGDVHARAAEGRDAQLGPEIQCGSLRRRRSWASPGRRWSIVRRLVERRGRDPERGDLTGFGGVDPDLGQRLAAFARRVRPGSRSRTGRRARSRRGHRSALTRPRQARRSSPARAGFRR